MKVHQDSQVISKRRIHIKGIHKVLQKQWDSTTIYNATYSSAKWSNWEEKQNLG